MLRLSQMTWNGSKLRFAHFEAARQFLLRKLEQGLGEGRAPTALFPAYSRFKILSTIQLHAACGL
jgi:hypothetical protein